MPEFVAPQERCPVRRSVIDETWERLEREMRKVVWSEHIIAGIREGYVGALYAAAAAVSTERAHSRELAEAAARIERT
jgi:hypothetical protein